ncbi:uncharacterized mitochondrial protein-like protein [Tanacetum coccineum]
MLDKDLYDSWKSQMELYIQNREHGRMILESVEHGPLIWPIVEENVVTRTKKYAELSAAEKIQADCAMKATNIIIQVLKHSFPEWSKFVTDVKLVKDLHTTNFDQLHAYLEQHELHVNEVCLLRERNQDPLAFVANQQMTPPHVKTYLSSYNNPQLQQQFPPSQYGTIHPTQHYSSTYPSQPHFNHSYGPPSYPYHSQMNHQTSYVSQIAYQSLQVSTQPMTESPLVDSGFVVPVFSPGDDPIACLNKAMTFLTVVASSSNATSSGGNNASGQAKVVKCYNCQGEGHMARQCTQPKRPRNAAWYKDKAMLAEAQEAGQILDEEQLAFLADPGVLDGQAVQIIIPNNAAFQTEDLGTYNSDCDDISNAKAVLMANIYNYGSNIISEVPHSETYLNDMENQSVHAMQDFEQTQVVDFTDNEIHRDNNIILYSQYLQETQHANVQDTNLQAQQDLMILSGIEQMINHLRMSNPTSKSSDASLVKIEALKELPKVSLVNESLKKLKFHLAKFDNVVKIRTTFDARTEDVLLTVMNSMSLIGKSVNMDRKIIESCDKCFNLEAELLKSQNAHNDLLKSYSQLEKHCISLELSIQLNQEIFQKHESCDNQNALEIPEFFENNDLKAQLQDKDTTICKLKEIIKSMREKSKKEDVNYDYCEIETKNVFKDQFDSIKKTRVRTKELSDSLIDKLNLKSAENEDLKAQIQDKLDLEPLAPRLLQNRKTHIDYLMYTQEQDDILLGIVEQAKAK